jgi:hypothetical protein
MLQNASKISQANRKNIKTLHCRTRKIMCLNLILKGRILFFIFFFQRQNPFFHFVECLEMEKFICNCLGNVFSSLKINLTTVNSSYKYLNDFHEKEF